MKELLPLGIYSTRAWFEGGELFSWVGCFFVTIDDGIMGWSSCHFIMAFDRIFNIIWVLFLEEKVIRSWVRSVMFT